MRPVGIAALLAGLAAFPALPADVVINEIFYHAPDDLDDLQWIELHNTADRPVDLGGWAFDKSLGYTFPKGTTIEAGGYLVVALEPRRFQEVYGESALGPLKRPLKRGGERIELLDAGGERVDVVRYKDREPWPVSADGYSASLERISPLAPGDIPENWAASPLPSAARKPSGTPGKQNVSFSAVLPPVIASVTSDPDEPAPGKPLRVEAEVKDKVPLREVSLLYRLVAAGAPGEETAVPMAKDAATGRYRAIIPGAPADTLLRYRIRAVNEAGARRLYPDENDLRPTLSLYVHDRWEPAKIPFGIIILAGQPPPGAAEVAARSQRPGGWPGAPFGGGRPGRESGPWPGGPPGAGFGPMGQGPQREARPPRGASAFIFVDPKTGKTTVFDHVNVIPRTRNRGYKVYFHKDRTLGEISAANLVFEGSERFLLAEALSYDVYRRAGNAACLTEFVRVWVNGRLEGYHLMVERPNKSFLRRNNIRDDGNLYKVTWFARDIVGRYEKRTNTQTDHEDLLAIIEKLEEAKGEEQWKVIQEEINVHQMATFFAVNMVLSDWDGFFNNYFVYHDIHGTKKWEIYPWDRDKTWGHYDGIREGEVFFDMPLTYGMEGDAPPGARDGRGGGGFWGPFGGAEFGGPGASWWRRGGEFSRPLLANPQFRKVYLSRLKEILETVYTPEIYFPLIDSMADRLREDVRLAAEAYGKDPESGTRILARNVESLKTHLVKRRQFLLDAVDRELGTASIPESGDRVGGR